MYKRQVRNRSTRAKPAQPRARYRTCLLYTSTIIVTHDPEEALTLSDRVLIIDQGTIAQYGRPADIIQKPENDFVRTFILNQLEIKRNNIYALFGADAAGRAG